MPTIFSHIAVPLAIGLGLGNTVVSRGLLLTGMFASILPDLDVVAFHFGIPYASHFGHRGLSHSILFAFIIAILAMLAFRFLKTSRISVFLFVLVSTLSHALFDALTNGGLGVALYWPWSDERIFAPWHVIQVSPIGTRFFSEKAFLVIQSELLWVWLPCTILMLSLLLIGRVNRGSNDERAA